MKYGEYEDTWQIPKKEEEPEPTPVTPEEARMIGAPAVQSQTEDTITAPSGVSYAGEIPIEPPVVRKVTDDFMLLSRLGS